MENQKTKYDLLLDQLEFIKQKALARFNDENMDGNATVFVDVTPKLARISQLISDLCGPGFHPDENGNCVPD